ncbi:branched-chain amino acid ABC transporter permease [Halobacteriales archaeon Cl-PHB]
MEHTQAILQIQRFVDPFVDLVQDVAALDPVLLQLLAFSLLLGGIYGLTALGLTMIFGVMDVINFAHGALLTVGAYLLWQLADSVGMNPFILIPVVVAVSFGLGLVIHVLTIEPIIEAPQQNQLIVTFGLGLIFGSFIEIYYSPDPRTLGLELGQLEVAGTFLPLDQVYALVIALLTMGVVYYALQHTDVGRSIRGTADNRTGARYVGIDVPRINALTFGIGTALAGLAGAALAISQSFDPYIGEAYLINAFVIVVLGGLGSFPGAILGGLIIGFVHVFGAFYLPGTSYQVMIFLVFIAVLLVKPEGLLGRGEADA